jgi:hypothetical protein
LALTLEKTAKVVSQLLSAHALDNATKQTQPLQSAIKREILSKVVPQLQSEEKLECAFKIVVVLTHLLLSVCKPETVVKVR